MHHTLTILAVFAAFLVILLATCSCSTGSGKAGDSAIPCETVIAIWALVQCPGAPPLFPPR